MTYYVVMDIEPKDGGSVKIAFEAEAEKIIEAIEQTEKVVRTIFTDAQSYKLYSILTEKPEDYTVMVNENIKKGMEIKECIANITRCLEEWLFDNWNRIEKEGIEELHDILTAYLHGFNE